MLKLNTLLAKVESSTSVFRKLISEYKKFFENKESEFKGTRKTYSPREGTKDEPSMRQLDLVVTTVSEKLGYLERNGVDHINNVMNVEATNASGAAKAQLVIDNFDFGKLSSLELMKLKSILEKEGLEGMYASLPVRSDSIIWEPTTDEMYIGRNIYETKKQEGINKSLEKEEIILEDPNLKNMTDTSRYSPVKGMKNKVLDLGDYTVQHFSGQTTHRFRASILERRSKLLVAINAALKEANDTEVIESEFKAQELFNYLHSN